MVFSIFLNKKILRSYEGTQIARKLRGCQSHFSKKNYYSFGQKYNILAESYACQEKHQNY